MTLSTFEFQELEQRRYPQESCPYVARHQHHCSHCGWTDGTQLPDDWRAARDNPTATAVDDSPPAWPDWCPGFRYTGNDRVDWSLWQRSPDRLTRTLYGMRLTVCCHPGPGRVYWYVEDGRGEMRFHCTDFPAVHDRDHAGLIAMAAAQRAAVEYLTGDAK